MIQNFTLHSHNNELRFDGRASAKEMISSALAKGFKTIGVSNHAIVHENMNSPHSDEPMFFSDYNIAQDAYKRHIEILENLKQQYPIDIKIGFEVDFFQNKNWRNNFEKIFPQLNTDYLIGSNHFIKSKDESFIRNIYHIKHYPPMAEDELHEYTLNHFQNIEACIRSGYFTFIAHIDYCNIFGIGLDERYNDAKYRIIEALKETKTPYEINTSGYDRIDRPHPDIWMIKELAKAKVPTLLSDDAHCPEHLGRHFARAEDMLKICGYTKDLRLTPEML